MQKFNKSSIEKVLKLYDLTLRLWGANFLLGAYELLLRSHSKSLKLCIRTVVNI